MTTIHRTAFHEDPKQGALRQRLQPLNPRNYSSSKQLTSNGFDFDFAKSPHDRSRFLEPLLPSIERADQKNQPANRLRVINQRERYEVLRKNASLKLLRRDDGVKGGYKSRAEEGRQLETLGGTRQDKTSLEAQSQNSIPLKRGQLLKRSQNYLRIKKRNDFEKQPQKSDVSFEDGLEKAHPQEVKVVQPVVVCSENLLGNGMRKYSSAKMKALVTNPFERMQRQQEEAKEIESHQLPSSQAEQFKESQILEGDSCPSTTQQQQLQELLGML